ncbi:MAG: hypothetical protein KAW12_27445 [Candidatus Aminicenantes bacterium]|nr:hypothetical protein [Candidatus Aminicenantes bacterium]
MTKLRHRMIEDMHLHGLSENTQNASFGLSTTRTSRNQKVLKVGNIFLACKRSIINSFQACKKNSCQKCARFDD